MPGVGACARAAERRPSPQHHRASGRRNRADANGSPGALCGESQSHRGRTVASVTPSRHGGRVRPLARIRAPARGATRGRRGASQDRARFNPRPRTGGDTAANFADYLQAVSIRAPARGATAATVWGVTLNLFQSAPPHGGRLGVETSTEESQEFQSAPPHGGRHRHTGRVRRLDDVSIRAPARGATGVPLPLCETAPVSIRAPARGATPCGEVSDDLDVVSIRAPARGATPAQRQGKKEDLFQSAPPHGGRPRVVRSRTTWTLFQSAPPHGGRLLPSVRVRRRICFNPRPRTGGDFGPVCRSSRTPSFNPRPRTGGDADDCVLGRVHAVSIRAPARGATRVSLASRRSGCRFNPRPRTGGDTASRMRTPCGPCFNPRPRTGGDWQT